MKYYGGTVTVQGRNLITSLLAGETIEFTRIVVGSGKMPEGMEPIDMVEMVQPVAEATSTIPVVENGEMRLIVEYRNDMNGGLKKGFWLSEFAIYAKTENMPECMLYYATLGDSPQPVNAFKDNRIDIRRYPVTIALEVDADVEVSYNPGSFLTSEDAQEILGNMVRNTLTNLGSALNVDIIIPKSGWVETPADDEDGYGEYKYRIDVAIEAALEEHFPITALNPRSTRIAGKADMSTGARTFDGFIRYWANAIPSADLIGTVNLRSPTPIVPDIEPGPDEPGTDVPPSGDNIATDKEVQDTLDDIFGSNSGGSGGTETPGEGEDGDGNDTGDGEGTGNEGGSDDTGSGDNAGGSGNTGGDDSGDSGNAGGNDGSEDDGSGDNSGETGGGDNSGDDTTGDDEPSGDNIATDKEVQDTLEDIFGKN